MDIFSICVNFNPSLISNNPMYTYSFAVVEQELKLIDYEWEIEWQCFPPTTGPIPVPCRPQYCSLLSYTGLITGSEAGMCHIPCHSKSIIQENYFLEKINVWKRAFFQHKVWLNIAFLRLTVIFWCPKLWQSDLIYTIFISSGWNSEYYYRFHKVISTVLEAHK